MNPMQQSRLTPEIMEALRRRQMGGLSGGAGAPAQSQVMAPNPLGGSIGPSASPLQTSPQAVPSGSIPSSTGAPAPQGMDPSMSQQGAPSPATTAGGSKSDPDAVLMKALLQRLIASR